MLLYLEAEKHGGRVCEPRKASNEASEAGKSEETDSPPVFSREKAPTGWTDRDSGRTEYIELKIHRDVHMGASQVALVVRNTPANSAGNPSGVRKIPRSRAIQPTTVFLPGKFHGQRAWQAMVHVVPKGLTQPK